ncbi:hypothetical protein TFLX_03105 [Thermoflexales bacterium]|nr:hypothetical protein TFLX_03105 [Thermoflexales bacterium]
MVEVVEVNEKNRVVHRYSAALVLPKDCDVITLNPGVPPLGSAAFDEWLREWHRVNNDRSIVAAEVG